MSSDKTDCDSRYSRLSGELQVCSSRAKTLFDLFVQRHYITETCRHWKNRQIRVRLPENK
ncbi:MAG: hypothetical protein J5680_06385 [Neisseriaceae bacterium]|nr:hypothetical protein [Neisseriaceae bacterium]